MSNKEGWSNMTTIRVHDKVRDHLKSLKIRKNETIESVIKRILATIEQNNLEITTEEIL